MGSDARAKAAARQRQRVVSLLAAGKQHLRDFLDEFLLLGKSRTWAEIRALLELMLQPYLDYDAALARARAEVGQLRLTLRRNSAANGPWLAAFAEGLRGRYGRSHPAMRWFGVGKGNLKKPGVATLAAAAVARRVARAEADPRGKRRKTRRS